MEVENPGARWSVRRTPRTNRATKLSDSPGRNIQLNRLSEVRNVWGKLVLTARLQGVIDEWILDLWNTITYNVDINYCDNELVVGVCN